MSDFIIFSINKSDYALDVNNIDRIDQIPKLTPIPNAHPFIDGLMSYQDHTIKVVSFRKITEAQGEEPQLSSQKLLIYRSKEGLFAIKVDGIKDIIALEDRDIKPYSHQVKVGSCLQTRGVVEYKKSLVVVIDSVRLPEEEAA